MNCSPEGATVKSVRLIQMVAPSGLRSAHLSRLFQGFHPYPYQEHSYRIQSFPLLFSGNLA